MHEVFFILYKNNAEFCLSKTVLASYDQSMAKQVVRLRLKITVLLLIVIVALLVIFHSWISHQVTLQHIEQVIKDYGYLAIFIITLVGNFGVPVPEETTTILSGLFARQGYLSYPLVLLVCIFSAICGDNLGYWAGRLAGRDVLIKNGAMIGMNHEKMLRFEEFFQRHGSKTVFLARFVAGLRFFGGPISGTAKMPFAKFFMFNALGAIVYATIMTQIGFHFGLEILQLVERMKWWVALVAAIIIAVWYLRSRGSRRL